MTTLLLVLVLAAGSAQRSVMTAVAPPYPVAALHAGVEATVAVDVRFGADGAAVSTQQTPMVPLLAAAIEAAALKWRLSPATTATAERLTFVFRMTRDASASTTFHPPYRVEVLGQHVQTSDPVGTRR